MHTCVNGQVYETGWLSAASGIVVKPPNFVLM